MLETAALLPIKAHSERVKNKNFKLIAGKPLYRWVLDRLLDAKSIDKIIINTDAQQLLENKELINNPKIILRERKPELRGDFVSMNKILADDIDSVPAKYYLMTHATQPTISKNSIEEALKAFKQDKDHDSLFTVTKYLSRFYLKDMTPINHNPKELLRTQDLPPLFEENSCLYIFTKESFTKTNARIGANPMLYECSKIESVDVDDQQDWFIAESILKNLNNKPNENIEQ